VNRLRRTGVGAAIIVFVSLAVVGCSNRDASINNRPQPSGTAVVTVVDGVQQVTLHVGDTYRFSPSVITVHPGQVKVTLVHTGTGAPHDFQVVGFPGDFVPLVRPKGTSSATFTAPAPGTYTFICTIHQAQGQVGKLIVTAN
jgi:plastocyanin